MVFEFDIEVRPEFDMPQWKGLSSKRPVHEFTDEDVDDQLEQAARPLRPTWSSTKGRSKPATRDRQAQRDLHGRRHQLSPARHEETIAVRPTLSFSDAKLEGFDKLMKGKKVGDTATAEAHASPRTPKTKRSAARKLTAQFEVLEVKQLKLPELTTDFLDRIGGFKDEAELRDEVRKELERQLKYQQQKQVRQQITALLTIAATWDLPPELLRRQAKPRAGAGRDGVASQRLSRRRNSAPTRTMLQNAIRLARPGAQRALHPGADRRGREDRGRSRATTTRKSC